jgi:hypothetical protein
MADGGGNIFVYLVGEQEVPADVTHVIIDLSVKIIPERAFYYRTNLLSVETHDGIEKIERDAFNTCRSLRGIKLPGVKEVGFAAFYNCRALTDVELGDKLETILQKAFYNCHSLQKIKMPSVRAIGYGACYGCGQLTDVELGDKLEKIMLHGFEDCPRLQRIAIPLKENMFPLDTISRYTQFDHCGKLSRVDPVGGIHKTISSLLLESWKDDMNQEIDHINQVLPNTPSHEKTNAIQRWIRSVLRTIDHYRAEHYALLNEDMTQLELAVWKAKIAEGEERDVDGKSTKKAKIDVDTIRKEQRITSGADIVIKNVLPFLQLAR